MDSWLHYCRYHIVSILSFSSLFLPFSSCIYVLDLWAVIGPLLPAGIRSWYIWDFTRSHAVRGVRGIEETLLLSLRPACWHKTCKLSSPAFISHYLLVSNNHLTLSDVCRALLSTLYSLLCPRCLLSSPHIHIKWWGQGCRSSTGSMVAWHRCVWICSGMFATTDGYSGSRLLVLIFEYSLFHTNAGLKDGEVSIKASYPTCWGWRPPAV